MGMAVVPPDCMLPFAVLQAKLNPGPWEELDALMATVAALQCRLSGAAMLRTGDVVLLPTCTSLLLKQPLAGLKTMAVYVPITFTVGQGAAEKKPLGPVHS